MDRDDNGQLPQEVTGGPNAGSFVVYASSLTFVAGIILACLIGRVEGSAAMLVIAGGVFFMATNALKGVWLEDIHARADEWRAKESIKRKVERALDDERAKLRRESARDVCQQKASYDFTSEDFDDGARVLLAPLVAESRKAKAKVTGQGLITTILRGLR